MNDYLFRISALLGGAAVIATAMAVNPATANDFKTIVRPDLVKKCASGKPCVEGYNTLNGPGVEALNSNAGNGVYAQAANNDAVSAQTTNPSASKSGRSGVYGFDGSSDGGYGNYGVVGAGINGTGLGGFSTNNYGVYAQSENSIALLAATKNPASIAAAIQASGFYGLMAFGQGGPSVYAANSAGDGNTTVEAIGGVANDTSTYNLATFTGNSTFAFGADNAGNAHVGGLIYTHGSCSGGCDRTRGQSVVSYAAQSTMPTLEDIGSGQLQNGEARVRFDADLARAIDRGSMYAVFLSPEGPNRGLYVTQKSSTGFTVVENPGGRSTIPFSYRIVAKPYGVKAARLPLMTLPRATRLTPSHLLPHPAR